MFVDSVATQRNVTQRNATLGAWHGVAITIEIVIRNIYFGEYVHR